MGVLGYDGLFGSGKSASAVRDLWHAKRQGRKIFANVPLIDRRERRERQYWFFGSVALSPLDRNTYGRSWADGPILTRLEEVADLDNCVCLLDEVELWMNNRRWNLLDDAVLVALEQQRKEGLDVLWTAPRSARVDKVLREITHTLWTCQLIGRKTGPKLSFQRAKDPETREDLGWRIRRLNEWIWNLYDSNYKIGSADGSIAGRLGKGSLYQRDPRAEELVRAGGLRRLPAYALLDREEDEYGNVRYRSGGDNMRWWIQRDFGLDPGPSPLLGARGVSGVPTGTGAVNPGSETVPQLRDFATIAPRTTRPHEPATNPAEGHPQQPAPAAAPATHGGGPRRPLPLAFEPVELSRGNR